MEETSPTHKWYKDVSVVISVLAFLFSLVTTWYASQQARQQQIAANKTELRDIITRISEIPRDYTAYAQTYTDPLILGQLNGSLQVENGMLAKRAVEISARLPGEVTSSEYLLIGQSLFYSNAPEEAAQMYQQAVATAKNANDLSAALRQQANLQMLLGEAEAGRATYQVALQVFERFPVNNDFYRLSTTAMTHMAWAASEFTIGECQAVVDHLAEAEALIDQLQPASSARLYRDQLTTYQASTAACGD